MSPLSFSKRGDVNTLDVHQPQGARLRLLVRTLEDSASHARESPVSTVLAVVLRDGKTLMALKSNAGVVRGWLVAVKGRALQEMDAVVSHFRRYPRLMHSVSALLVRKAQGVIKAGVCTYPESEAVKLPAAFVRLAARSYCTEETEFQPQARTEFDLQGLYS
ncbi:hypothetical protein WJX74_007839 [Apatococcus lobatus]|uniref:Uncharacterized protein n=1 Tax=Apatococcus lobatus TaxID=904363 RepID=A0AAW1R382_9CHLO